LRTVEPGPGPARNVGVAAARSDSLCFIDADVVVHPRWLEAGLAALQQDRSRPVGGDVRIGFADPRQPTGVEAFEAAFSFRQKIYIERENYSVTANLMMDRQVFEAAGPFGPIDTPEDIDFGKRATALGHKPRYVPGMLAWHPARPDVEAVRRKTERVARQKLTRHLAEGRSLAMFRLAALATMVSGPVMGVRMATTDRIEGLANRLKGYGVLMAVRFFKGLDMWRLASAHASGRLGEAVSWNR
ncbi:MAG: glycosyltransferase, partial [Sphingomonadaceae bacterium]